jgi:PleD family two-component response regulator
MGGASLPEVIARADKLLYQAKKTGKNKVIAG